MKKIKYSDRIIHSTINDSAIILACRNEENNLKKNLISFLDQKPSGHELLLVDDHSSDGTVSYLLELASGYPGLKVMKNESDVGKKHAVQQGILNTGKEYIFLTDADCRPVSDKWLMLMGSSFKNEDIDIVLGYSPYVGDNLLSKFIRFETFMTALQYFSYALSGMPYMGVGRNMAFRKEVFLKNNGYSSHLDIQSGNDDLFVMENANSENVAIQIDPQSFILTEPAKTIKEFFNQKARHISSSFRYKTVHKIMLAVYSISHTGFYLTSIILLLNGLFFDFFVLYSVRLIVISLISGRSMLKLKEFDLFKWIPVLDLFMFLYYITLAVYYTLKPKVNWK